MTDYVLNKTQMGRRLLAAKAYLLNHGITPISPSIEPRILNAFVAQRVAGRM